MSTYYHRNNNNNNNNNNNSEIQAPAADGLQTLLLMNPTAPYHPNLGSYSDTLSLQPHHHHHLTNNNNNLVFFNSVAASLAPHALNQQPQLAGIPLDPHHEISVLHHAINPRVPYNTFGEARDVNRSQQGGLFLSLRGSGGSTSSPRSEVSNKFNGGVNGMVLSSRYLKVAQELLDEVVSVGREIVKTKVARELPEVAAEAGSSGVEASGKYGGGEMSTAVRQEVQMRKAKLLGLLDEVDQRYRQYHHQMQIVISWFEQATGIGSAKTYTSLALQTISKQFRCLKDAISSQIRASSKSLGEEDSFGGSKNEGSRLKFVDHQIRQQRALQQLGMIQPNAWRPQRGLPERAVSVLRAWLFEHFLHPYPKDSDKIMLANQTGLTRSQVSNWFINARVRLWKPMVEEMYMEEIKDQEQNGSDDKATKSKNNNNEDSASKITTHQEKTPATEDQNMNFKSILDLPAKQISPPVISASPSPTRINTQDQPGFTLVGSPVMESIAQASPKKQRNNEFFQSPNSYLSNEQISMKFGDERQNRERFTLMGGPTNFIGGFGAYPIAEIGRFSAEQFPATYPGNGVSLTLGLPHCENLSLSGAHQSFLHNQNIPMGRRFEICESDEFATNNTSTPSHSSVGYESVNIQNRKRFPAQLLPDFVT